MMPARLAKRDPQLVDVFRQQVQMPLRQIDGEEEAAPGRAGCGDSWSCRHLSMVMGSDGYRKGSTHPTATAAICPTGKSPNCCLAPVAKIFLFTPDPNHFYNRRCLVPLEGRIAIVTDARRDAVAAASAIDEQRECGR